MKLILLFLLLTCSLFSQEKFQVLDSISKEPLPFVKVLPNDGTPGFTDIDGMFEMDSVSSIFQLRFQGYHEETVKRNELDSNTVLLRPIYQYVQEVVAMAGENPAHRIMDLVIANRRTNHPLRNDAFTYKSYSKFLFDVDEETKKALETDTSELDSSALQMKNHLDKHYIFLLESASERRFIPPARDREDITAYKTSGFSHPIFSTLAQSMQSFHFYDNRFAILGREYINPIAFGGTRRYLFILEDTTVVGKDTTFTIRYRPRLGKSFNGLKGALYINTNGYAIEKVTAQPYEDSVATIKIVQEYKITDNEKWFPEKLSTHLNLRNALIASGDTKGYIIGRGNTYIKEVDINPEGMKKRGFDNVAIATEEGAGDANVETWNKYRNDSVTEKEEKTYTFNDSIVKDANGDKLVTAALALATGKLRIKKINLLLDRFVNYNFYEQLRLGAGLETSNLLWKKFAIGGYFGYGFGDKAWKYGGYSLLKLSNRKRATIKLSYEDDLLHRGGYSTNRTGLGLNSSELVRLYFRTYMEKQRKAGVAFTYAPLANLQLQLDVDYRRVWYTDSYHFLPHVETRMEDKLDVATTKLEMQWNMRERPSLFGDFWMAKPTNYPKINLQITQAWPGIEEAKQAFTKIHIKLEEHLKTVGLGTFHFVVSGDHTFGEVPLFFNNTAIGTRQDWNLAVDGTFQTAFPGEFYHDKQAAFFFKYDFPTIRTKAGWNEPQFSLYHGIGYGEMVNKINHSVLYKTMDKGLYEAGLAFNGMLTSNLAGFGLGVFYRYGSYASSNWERNLVPKITATFNL